ncbi:MAG: MerR family transcriptional regulator [Chloroflexi bacterium HGW-Chloroflexi-10]|nr:MAG: MerR family transcriptional regulator [Chloroflexi bacterium HGW-Chloroflexi-10]
MDIGKKVNERRKEIGLSLRELGELSGLTAGFLSQIENDQVSPSLNSLQSIAAALKVPMFYLINNTPSGLVVKANERSKVFFPDSQMGYDLLTPDFSRQMMAIIIRMNPFTKRIAMPLAKSTEQWMHILTGCMQIKIGEEIFTLEPGDTIYYDGDSLVEFGSISEDELVVICSITPPVF